MESVSEPVREPLPDVGDDGLLHYSLGKQCPYCGSVPIGPVGSPPGRRSCWCQVSTQPEPKQTLTQRMAMGILLLALLSLIYFLQIPANLLRLVLWAPIFYDVYYLLERPTQFGYVMVLVFYAYFGTEIMINYYQEPATKSRGLLIILVVTVSDILQYFCGKYFGHSKTGGPSPNKTWEGYAGVLLTIACFWYWVPARLSLFWCLSGAFGDIFESWCKRRLHVKDSSNLLGAHGGWFDRLDGIFMAMIISQLYLG